MTTDFDTKLEEIRNLLAEAYKHYFETTDGASKSGEGQIMIIYPPYYWDAEVCPDPTPHIEVYSSVLGPSRNHYFGDIDEALEAVKGWHEGEMNRV